MHRAQLLGSTARLRPLLSAPRYEPVASMSSNHTNGKHRKKGDLPTKSAPA